MSGVMQRRRSPDGIQAASDRKSRNFEQIDRYLLSACDVGRTLKSGLNHYQSQSISPRHDLHSVNESAYFVLGPQLKSGIREIFSDNF
jgi:hypothetical protein